MKLSRFVVPALLGLMGLYLTSTAVRADSIGINFNADNAVNNIAAGTSAGVVAQTNWNNLGGVSGTSGALRNNLGATTTTTLNYAAQFSGSLGVNPAGGDE